MSDRSSKPPEVSVVVVNWNRRDMLLGCLRSLDRQTEVRFETILVDNGSDDGSFEAARALEPELSYPLRIIRNEHNAGFCAANNQGIAVAQGEWIALLNNDAEAEPGWLAAMLHAGGDDARIGMVACKILVFDDPQRIDKAGHLIWPDGQNRGRGTGERDHGQYDKVEEVLWPDGCAALYRRSMLAQIGGFDEDLFAYGDDAELGLRARIAGWRCLYTPAAIVRHRRGSTLGLFSPRRLELIERNRLLLAIRHFPVSLLLLNPLYTLLRVWGGAIAAFRGRGEVGKFRGRGSRLRVAKALLSGSMQGLAMARRTWAKRRRDREIRVLRSGEIRDLLRRGRISLRALSEEAN